MRYLTDFLTQTNITKTLIYPHLQCSKEEGEVLRFLLAKALDGENEVRAFEIIQACFALKAQKTSKSAQNKPATSHKKSNLTHTTLTTISQSSSAALESTTQDSSTQNSTTYDFARKLAQLSYVAHIKSLVDSGWISIVDFNFVRKDDKDLSLLELLQLEVALSSSFYQLIEEGVKEAETSPNTPYTDHLEYLNDQFLRLSLIASLKNKKSATTANEIRLIQERIDSRLKHSKIDIPAHNLIKELHLNKKEELIFFALLKEEYFGGDGYYRDMNNLIDLISSSEYEKIQNRFLLDEKGALVEKGLLDYGEMLNPFGGIVRTFFIPEEVLRKLIQSPKKRTTKISLASALIEQEIFELIEPKVDLSDIILSESTQTMLDSILKQVDPVVIKRLQQWGIINKNKGAQAKILFYGAAGTGKTLSAQAIAKALKKPILSFDCSKILSMYVGESEKNVRKIFDSYKDLVQKSKIAPVLLLDEADQFLSSRIHSLSGAEKMHNQMQNIFLEQIERFSGVLVATTNLVETMDSAFSRRFDYKIEFKRPDSAMRERLWAKFLPKNAEYDESPQILATKLAHYDLSGAQIELVVKNTAYKVATQSQPIFHAADFIAAITREINGGFDSTKSVGFSTA